MNRLFRLLPAALCALSLFVCVTALGMPFAHAAASAAPHLADELAPLADCDAPAGEDTQSGPSLDAAVVDRLKERKNKKHRRSVMVLPPPRQTFARRAMERRTRGGPTPPRPAPPGAGAPIEELVHTAQIAARAGRLDAAASAWDRVLAAQPNHPQALLFLGQRSLRSGDARAAIELLQRGTRAAPKDPIVALNLAFAQRAAGDMDAEMVALSAALAADPYCYPALLARGSLLERRGNAREAARSFRDALKIVPSDDRLSPDMKALADHARKAVQENTQALDAFLETKLGATRGKHDCPQNRFNEAKDAMVGRKQVYVSEASLFRVPQLPAIPFFDRKLFPWLADFEAQTPAIREELLNLLHTKKDGFHPYMQYPSGVPLNQWAELNNNLNWRSLDLWKDGKRIEEHAVLCPRTMTALDAVPLAFIPDVAPCALFSALEPHTHIPAHAGVTNARSLVHLPLIVPGPARFRVANEVREWKIGEAWVFDDTLEHEAWNDADQLRVIMIVDVWNPLLSEGERELIAAAISGYYEFYRGV